MNQQHRLPIALAFVCFLAIIAASAGADTITIEPGADLMTIQPDCQSSSISFETDPIPAGFFGPGSDPFFGRIYWQALPLTTTPPSVLDPTDCIVHRLDSAVLPAVGDTDQIPIELVALSLQGCTPITVTYNNGDPDEQWEVKQFGFGLPAPGSMTFTRECDQGGSFHLAVDMPIQLQFTRVVPPSTEPPLVLTFGSRLMEEEGIYYSAPSPPPGIVPITSDGAITVDQDGNPDTPEIPVLATNSDFFEGVGPLPCTPSSPPVCFGLESTGASDGELLPSEILSLNFSANIEVPMGATCLPDNSCVVTDPTCAASLGGTYQGDGTYCTSTTCATADTTHFDAIGDFQLSLGSGSDPNAACGDAIVSYSGRLHSDDPCANSLILANAPALPGEIGTGTIQFSATCNEPATVNIQCVADIESIAQITVTGEESDGRLIVSSVYNLWLQVDLPDQGKTLVSHEPMIATAAGARKTNQLWLLPIEGAQLQLFDASTDEPAGWLCGLLIQPDFEVDCAQPIPAGACCTPDGGCIDGLTRADCQQLNGIYAGDNSTCLTATCPQDWPTTHMLVNSGIIRVDSCDPSLWTGSGCLDSGDDTPLGGLDCSEDGQLDIAMEPPVDNTLLIGQTFRVQASDLSMKGTSPTLGPICLRQTPDKPSHGILTVDSVDTDGMLTQASGQIQFNFEDMWPCTGDEDFNDAAIRYSAHVPITMDVLLRPQDCTPNSSYIRIDSNSSTVYPLYSSQDSLGIPVGGIQFLTLDNVENACWELSVPGVKISQISFTFDSANVPNSNWGELDVDQPTVLGDAGLTTGYLNMYTDLGWVVQNLYLSTGAETPDISTFFKLFCSYRGTGFNGAGTGGPKLLLGARVEVDALPQTSFGDGTRQSYTIDEVEYNAEGAGDLHTSIVPSPRLPDMASFFPTGPTEIHTQPNISNVQTAANQCFPMSIANSLEYLKDRYGLPVPNYHGPGLKGDSTLVGQLDSLSNRTATSRTQGRGVGFVPMLSGKFEYLHEHGLDHKVVCSHQGVGYGSAPLSPGDFSAHGVTSKDTSTADGHITFDWICNQLQRGEDVEIVVSYDDSLGNPVGGHAVRAFQCGTILGAPFIGYVHDRQQTNQHDPHDSLGLQPVQEYVSDVDGDGLLNLGSADCEIRFAFSESADNDRDSVTDGVDNAPNEYNPGQEDENGDGVGDVLQLPVDENVIPPFDLSGANEPSFGPYDNTWPTNPDHKDIWFTGSATNPSGSDSALVKVYFDYYNDQGQEVIIPSKDTTYLPPNSTREVFGSARLDFCPGQVSVHFGLVDGMVTNLGGTLHHLCYPAPGCCRGIRGNVDNDDGDAIDISDLIYLVDYSFSDGPAPACFEEADVNGDLSVDISDIIYLVDYSFGDGPPPLPCP